MRLKLSFTTLFLSIIAFSFAQEIDSLKLNAGEIPAGYSQLKKAIFVTPHASSFYDQTDLYESFLGKVVKKDFQAFSKKGDEGSVLYFQFAGDFKGEDFLRGLLWGNENKATKNEPDEYFIKGRILVIWSFNLKSEIKKISMEKVKRLLN